MVGNRSDSASTGIGSWVTRAVHWLLHTQEGVLFLIVAAIWIFLTVQSDVFFTGRNIGVLLSQVSMTAITAVGMTILLISGEIDASVGSMQAFVGVIVMSVLNNTENLALGNAKQRDSTTEAQRTQSTNSNSPKRNQGTKRVFRRA